MQLILLVMKILISSACIVFLMNTKGTLKSKALINNFKNFQILYKRTRKRKEYNIKRVGFNFRNKAWL
jgi:hypothetical protein